MENLSVILANFGNVLPKVTPGIFVFTSPVMAGNRIYGTHLAGKTFVFEANPDEFKLIAANQLGDEVYASPVISGNRLYLSLIHI